MILAVISIQIPNIEARSFLDIFFHIHFNINISCCIFFTGKKGGDHSGKKEKEEEIVGKNCYQLINW